MSLEPRVLELSKYWAEAEIFDQETRKEIRHLIDSKQEKELTERFYRDLEFGTGGLRGILGAGSARMNIYNVRKAAHAVSLQLKESFGSQKTALKVALSYDSRKFSREFAEAACEVFAAHGIKAYITKELRPVPMLSFLIRNWDCQAGACVTASHNPPDYNGFKVYWSDGAQIIPPIDKKIIDRYGTIQKYEDIPRVDFREALNKGLVLEIGEELDRKYFEKVESLRLRPETSKKDFKIVYSPLHGTGAFPVREVLKRFGFENIFIVPEQEQPNGNFPTVKFPNPEEADALALAVEYAKKQQADIVLATDPDADRIGIVVRENNDYVYLNGNQIACLLVEYVLSSLKEKSKLDSNALVIKTIVTTDLQRKIAEYYGASCEETLTGFKWICGLIEDYESGKKKPYKSYVCGGEESFGFLMGHFVRDKDGVSSCAIAAEMVAYYKSKAKTLNMVLDDIYKRHGVYFESLHTITLPGRDGASKIASMMESFRSTPPKEIDGIAVHQINDYKTQKILQSSNGKLELSPKSINLPKSDVLQFILSDETRVSVRPSGTEPKIKFYVSVHSSVPKERPDDLAKIKLVCKEKTKSIENLFVKLASQQ